MSRETRLDRLDRLNELLDSFENWKALQSFFIGALSTLVDDESWDEALKTARNCALSMGHKEKQAPVSEAKVEVIS